MTEVDKVRYEEKMISLKNRITNTTLRIGELEEKKICLMMVKRDMMMSHTKKVLEDCFTDELKDKISSNVDKWSVSHRLTELLGCNTTRLISHQLTEIRR